MRVFFLAILAFMSIVAHSQQFMLPSQINRNLVYMNPAYSGIHETAVANIMHRSSLIGIVGAPTQQNLEFHSPLKKQSVALGLQVRNEQIGATNSTEVFFNYGHRINFGESKLAFGLKAGISNQSMSELDLQDDLSDPAFEASKGQFAPNFGFGISYYAENYFAGLSIPYLLTAISGTDGSTAVKYDMNNFNYVLSLGAKYSVNSDILIEPFASLVYSSSIDPSYLVMVNGNYKRKLLSGLGYRYSRAVVMTVGYQANNQISFLYSYEYNFGEFGAYLRASHEISLQYYWGYDVKTVNPRDF